MRPKWKRLGIWWMEWFKASGWGWINPNSQGKCLGIWQVTVHSIGYYQSTLCFISFQFTKYMKDLNLKESFIKNGLEHCWLEDETNSSQFAKLHELPISILSLEFGSDDDTIHLYFTSLSRFEWRRINRRYSWTRLSLCVDCNHF